MTRPLRTEFISLSEAHGREIFLEGSIGVSDLLAARRGLRFGRVKHVLKASRGEDAPSASALTPTMEVTPCMARADANNTTQICLDSLGKKSLGSCSNW